MTEENTKRAVRYHERAGTLRSMAGEAEEESVRTALNGAAAGYDDMARKRETSESVPSAK